MVKKQSLLFAEVSDRQTAVATAATKELDYFIVQKYR